MEETFRWLHTGHEALQAMLAALGQAQKSIRLETYIFQASGIGQKFLDALVAAAQRGVRVQVMIDAVGSLFVPSHFWKPLLARDGQVKVFNPLSLHRLSYRNHRKLLVCDESLGFVGGFNLADDYNGDGITKGWRDLGLAVTGPLAQALAQAFDEIFATVAADHKRLHLFKEALAPLETAGRQWQLLLSGPGRKGRRMRSILSKDIAAAHSVKIISAYFLPPWRMRLAFARVCRRGGSVQLILAGQSDVAISQLASRQLYRSLLRRGVEIYEYQPQILHAKLILIDDVVCIGSANLDTRSLIINHELLVRLTEKKLAAEAHEIFAHDLAYSRRIEPATWRQARSFWSRWLERFAYFILAHVDPYLARLQVRFFRRQSTTTPSRASAASAVA